MTKIFIGLGSNLGDREQNIREAVRLLQNNDEVKVIKVSSLYETEPEGIKDQPLFLNGVLEAETSLTPRTLLNIVKDIERQLGRRRKGRRWGPRIIDLDILMYGDLIIKETDLEIPHPLMDKRSFVLIPLAEIASEVKHPVLKKTVSSLRDGKKV